MQVIKQPQDRITSTTEKQDDPPFSRIVINS